MCNVQIVCHTCNYGLKICCIFVCTCITLTFNSTVWPELHGRGIKICCIFFTALLHLHFHSTYTHTYVTWLSSIPCTVIGHYLKIEPTRTNVYMCKHVYNILYHNITFILHVYVAIDMATPSVCGVWSISLNGALPKCR